MNSSRRIIKVQIIDFNTELYAKYIYFHANSSKFHA